MWPTIWNGEENDLICSAISSSKNFVKRCPGNVEFSVDGTISMQYSLFIYCLFSAMISNPNKMHICAVWLMRQFVWGIQSIVLRKFNKFFSVSSILVDNYLVYFVAVIAYINVWFSIKMFMFTRIDASLFVRTEKYDLVYLSPMKEFAYFKWMTIYVDVAVMTAVKYEINSRIFYNLFLSLINRSSFKRFTSFILAWIVNYILRHK